MKYYQHNIGDHLSIAAHLTVIEDGILRRAMDYCLANECALPCDLSGVMRVLRVTHGVTDEALCVTLRNALRNVLDEFFTLRNDEYHCDAVDKILSGYHEKAPSAERSRSANAERQARLRERKKELQAFIINTLGIPASDRLSVKELEQIIADNSSDKPECVTRDASQQSNVSNALPNHKPLTINQEPLSNTHTNASEDFAPDLEQLNEKLKMAGGQVVTKKQLDQVLVTFNPHYETQVLTNNQRMGKLVTWIKGDQDKTKRTATKPATTKPVASGGDVNSKWQDQVGTPQPVTAEALAEMAAFQARIAAEG